MTGSTLGDNLDELEKKMTMLSGRRQGGTGGGVGEAHAIGATRP